MLASGYWTYSAGLLETREELRFRATHDALTGIANRGVILEALGRDIGAIRVKAVVLR